MCGVTLKNEAASGRPCTSKCQSKHAAAAAAAAAADRGKASNANVHAMANVFLFKRMPLSACATIDLDIVSTL